MSKGSRRRPQQVAGDEVRSNWDKVFKKCEHKNVVKKLTAEAVCEDCGKILVYW